MFNWWEKIRGGTLGRGTQREWGSLFVERISAHATCAQQRRNSFVYLMEVCVARFDHRPAPSLLPPSIWSSERATYSQAQYSAFVKTHLLPILTKFNISSQAVDLAEVKT